MKFLSCAFFTFVLFSILANIAVADTEITHNGVTWTIQGDNHQKGEFVNGEPWIVGPVTVVGISNNLNSPDFTPRAGQNGSMVNPLVGHDRQKQGYDDSLGSYDASLNASRPNGRAVSQDNPLVLKKSSTLISMVSWLFNSPDDTEPGCPRVNKSMNAPRPATRAAGILTVLDKPAAADSFRPPYAGAAKEVKFNVSMLKKSKLQNLEPAASMPDISKIEKYMARTWVDHTFEWLGGYVHPSEHMPNYGRDMARQTAIVATALQVDFNKLPGKPSKDKLLGQFVQYGIDLAGIADSGGGWRANGGHGLGRKWPILFAGVMLGDDHMSSVGYWKRDFDTGVEFQEDQQFFYVTEKDVKLSHSDKWSPDRRDVKAGNNLPYDTEHIGMAEWGIRHGYAPEQDNRHMAAKYRMINSGVMPAFVLVARMMGLENAWNHGPLFDYSDRFMNEYNGGRKLTGGRAGSNTMDTFLLDMWHKYAGKLPEITHYKDNKPGAFSLTCDDGFRHQVNNTLEALDPLGIKATFFIMPLVMENPERAAELVTWQQVKRLHAAGHEIGTHGTIAEPLHKAEDRRLDELINGSFQLIKDKAGITSVSYACPGGSKANDRVQAVIFQNHHVLRKRSAQFPEMKIAGYGSTDRRKWEDQATRTRISNAIDEGKWFVAITHAIIKGWSPFKSKDEFRTHCQWIASQADKLWIAPMGEVGMYLKARKYSHVEIIEVSEKSAKLSLNCDKNADDCFRKIPLTVSISAKAVSEVSASYEDGSEIDVKISQDNLLLNIVPDGRIFTVSWK